MMCLRKIKIYVLVNILLAIYVDNEEKGETLARLTENVYKTYLKEKQKSIMFQTSYYIRMCTVVNVI